LPSLSAAISAELLGRLRKVSNQPVQAFCKKKSGPVILFNLSTRSCLMLSALNVLGTTHTAVGCVGFRDNPNVCLNHWPCVSCLAGFSGRGWRLVATDAMTAVPLQRPPEASQLYVTNLSRALNV
jgi:hypothetical protein